MSRRHRRAAVRMYRRLAEVTFDPIAGLDGMDHEANLERVTSDLRVASAAATVYPETSKDGP
jgi:hypothetical protein